MSPRKRKLVEEPMATAAAPCDIIEEEVCSEFPVEETETIIPEPTRPRLKPLSMFRGKQSEQPVGSLARETRTKSMVLAALRERHGWTERTRISRSEFIRLRDEWLKQPASEV